MTSVKTARVAARREAKRFNNKNDKAQDESTSSSPDAEIAADREAPNTYKGKTQDGCTSSSAAEQTNAEASGEQMKDIDKASGENTIEDAATKSSSIHNGPTDGVNDMADAATEPDHVEDSQGAAGGEHPCQFCDRKLTRKWSMRRHLCFHLNTLKPSEGVKKARILALVAEWKPLTKCDSCPLYFSRPARYKVHRGKCGVWVGVPGPAATGGTTPAQSADPIPEAGVNADQPTTTGATIPAPAPNRRVLRSGNGIVGDLAKSDLKSGSKAEAVESGNLGGLVNDGSDLAANPAHKLRARPAKGDRAGLTKRRKLSAGSINCGKMDGLDTPVAPTDHHRRSKSYEGPDGNALNDDHTFHPADLPVPAGPDSEESSIEVVQSV